MDRKASVVAAPSGGTLDIDDVQLLALRDAVAAGSISLVTSDVFDTIAFRPVDFPAAAFELIGEALAARGMLAAHVTGQSFGRLRAAAERRARRLRAEAFGDPEVSIAEIYRELSLVLAPGTQPGDAIAVEIAVERDLLTPNFDVVRTLCWIAGEGVPVIAVSDSYFSAAQLGELFAQPYLDELVFSRSFTSSDRRRNKGGGLLEEVLAELGVPAARVAHIGDHPEADVIVASATACGQCISIVGPRSYAGSWTASAASPSGELWACRSTTTPASARFAHSCCAARNTKRFRRARQLLALGRHVLGPVMTGFAEWVHTRLAELGTSRVWCLMREGAFLSERWQRRLTKRSGRCRSKRCGSTVRSARAQR